MPWATGEAKPVAAGAGDEKYLAYLLEQRLCYRGCGFFAILAR